MPKHFNAISPEPMACSFSVVVFLYSGHLRLRPTPASATFIKCRKRSLSSLGPCNLMKSAFGHQPPGRFTCAPGTFLFFQKYLNEKTRNGVSPASIEYTPGHPEGRHFCLFIFLLRTTPWNITRPFFF